MRHIHTQGLAIAILATALTGCVDQKPKSASQSAPKTSAATDVANSSPSSSMTTDVGAPTGSIEFAGVTDVQDLIRARSAEYDKLTVEARQQGMMGGALRGALLGLIIDAGPATIAGGAVLGGIVGASTGERVASQLIQEHKNYLIRRWSLEKVLESVKTDSRNTRFDLILSSNLVKTKQAQPAAPVSKAAIADLSTFKSHAVSRALALREVLPLYSDNPAATRRLEAELKTQMAMISDFQRNIKTLEALA